MWAFPEIATLGDIPRFYARRIPHRAALLHRGRTTSFGELEVLSSKLSAAFLQAGISRGDTIAYLGRNSDDYFVALFAAAKIGSPFLPMNWRLSPFELSEVMAHAAPSMLIAEKDLAETHGLSDVSRGPPDLLHIQLVGDGGSPLRDWAETHDAVELPRVSPDETAMLLYTSGTTGQAKAVQIPHSAFNHMRLCEHLEPAFCWRDDDLMLLTLPNFHLFGNQLALQFLYNGLAVSILRIFDPAEFLATVKLEQPTTLVLVPAMVQLVLDHADAVDFDFSSVHTLIYSGSPISPTLLQRSMQQIGCRFMQYYGATELNGAAMLLRPDEHDANDPQRLRSCGRPLPLVDIRILNPKGEDVAIGVVGELVIRTPALTAGYYGGSPAAQYAYREGWYHTGDAGYRDAAGYYYICDRLKDMIVSGGENIYSAEVEKVLAQHPAVKMVAVIAVPHSRWGEAVKACVVIDKDHSVGVTELESFARQQLAGYKIPKSFDFLESLPLSATGKILKHVLREPYWANQARSIG
jgi:acyl-CoA synthetase (AMP-forming)/AMP-acid ligase II